MTEHSGYGSGGYGDDGYGHSQPDDHDDRDDEPEIEPDPTPVPDPGPEPDPTLPMTDTYQESGEQLDNDLEEFDERLTDTEETLASLSEQLGRGGIREDQVKRLLNEELEGAINYDRLAEEVVERIDVPAGGGSGGEGGVSSGLEEELRLAYDPTHIGTLETGDPAGSMHDSTGWGPVYEIEQTCVFRGAVVDAAESGTVTFRFYELESDDVDAEFVDEDQEPHRTRKVEVYPGQQFVNLDVPLSEGYWFISKDERLEPGECVPLLRSEGNDPADINGGDAPIRWLRGWHPDYRPRVDQAAYGRYQDGNWAQNYHYLWTPEVGYRG